MLAPSSGSRTAPDASATAATRWPAALRWLPLALAAAWLALPVLTPAHVEGFSASIVSLGLHLAHGGDVAAYDRLFPVNLEFFGLSRMGNWLAVALLARIPGVDGELAMRLTLWIGLVLLTGSSLALVRRWTGASLAVGAAALLLLPGFLENAFFYADNVLSAGLATSALLLVERARARTGAVALVGLAIGGVLLGVAVLARTDAILVGAAAPLLLLPGRPSLASDAPATVAVGARAPWRDALVRLAVFGAAGAATVCGVLALFDATILDVLGISAYMVRIWGRGLALKRHVLSLVLFVGIPAAVLVPLALGRLARARDAWRLALLVGVPLVYNVVALGKVLESRQLLPITPFLAALTVLGWQALAPAPGAPGARRWARPAFVGLVLAVWLAPPLDRRMDDGPRALTGRLYSPPRWRAWQRAINRNHDDLEAFAATLAAPARRTAVLTDFWDGDRYFHLALQEVGFRPVAMPTGAPACARAGEAFARGDAVVLHLRLHVPHAITFPGLTPQRLERVARPCLAESGVAELYVLGAEDWLTRQLGAALPRSAWVAREHGTLGATGYPPQVAVPLDASALDTLDAAYQRVARDTWRAPWAARGPRDLAAAERLLARRVPFPGAEHGEPARPSPPATDRAGASPR